MSLFEDLDVASADSDPFAIPDDTYNFVITDVKNSATEKDGVTKKAFIIEYTIVGGEHDSKTKDEYKVIPDASMQFEDAKKFAQLMGFLKARLESLGILQSKMNTVSKEDLMGLTGSLTLKTKGQYQNIVKLDVDAPVEVFDGSAPGQMFK